MRVEEDNFCVMKWTAMKVYYFMNLVSYTHASCLIASCDQLDQWWIRSETVGTNHNTGASTQSSEGGLHQILWLCLCCSISASRILVSGFQLSLNTPATTLVWDNTEPGNVFRFKIWLFPDAYKSTFSSIPLLLIVTECSGKWKCSEYLFEPLFALLNV